MGSLSFLIYTSVCHFGLSACSALSCPCMNTIPSKRPCRLLIGTCAARSRTLKRRTRCSCTDRAHCPPSVIECITCGLCCLPVCFGVCMSARPSTFGCVCRVLVCALEQQSCLLGDCKSA